MCYTNKLESQSTIRRQTNSLKIPEATTPITISAETITTRVNISRLKVGPYKATKEYERIKGKSENKIENIVITFADSGISGTLYLSAVMSYNHKPGKSGCHRTYN